MGAILEARATSSGGRPPRVVYWNHSPTPYFVERFNAVADRGTLDFEAWFNDVRESGRSWDVDPSDWRFPARLVPRRSLLGWNERVPLPELRAVRPDLLVQEYDRSHLAAGFLGARALAGRTAFRTLPNYDDWSERTWWREASKHVLFRAVDGAKVPGPDGAALARRYGLPDDRIHRTTQSINVELYSRSRDVPAAERERGRAERGLEGCVFVFVGRLWWGKGVDVLLDAYRSVAERRPDVSLLLVGDGEDEQRLRERAAGLPRVSFEGFVQAADLPAVYALADAMVFPTLGDPNGLVVEEAMAAGLPVIVSEAAGDIRERVPEGRAGYVVPVRDVEVIAERMLALAGDPELRRSLSREGALIAARRAHAVYAEDFERFVRAVLAAPRRRSAAAAATRALGAVLASASRGRDATDVLVPGGDPRRMVELSAAPRGNPNEQ